MKNPKSSWCSMMASLAVSGAALVYAGTAFAHVFPQKQVPGAGATVASPAQISITFDGPLEPAFSTLTVADASGKPVSVAKAIVDPKQPAVITVALPTLAPGRYTVNWAAVASDGHRTHGDYKFNVR
jgi:methionine-rich copper-binding protein CopC